MFGERRFDAGHRRIEFVDCRLPGLNISSEAGYRIGERREIGLNCADPLTSCSISDHVVERFSDRCDSVGVCLVIE